MFERFTEKARHVLVLAQAEANDHRHNFLGTEHVLLGLVRETDGVAGRTLAAEGLTADQVRADMERIVGAGPDTATGVNDAEALAAIGIDLDEVRTAVEEAFGEGALDRPTTAAGRRAWLKRIGSPPFTPRTKKVLELALREALSMKHNYIGTEHLLLAILREGKGVAAQILAERTSDFAELRAKVLDELSRLRPGA